MFDTPLQIILYWEEGDNMDSSLPQQEGKEEVTQEQLSCFDGFFVEQYQEYKEMQ